jgi:hypothetical protein
VQTEQLPRRVKPVRTRRRSISGLGLILIVGGVVVLLAANSFLPRSVYNLWPLIVVAIGVFGLLRRPGWVQELDLYAGPQVSRVASLPQRVFSWFLVGLGVVLLLLTTHVISERLIAPVLLVALGLVLIWRRAR